MKSTTLTTVRAFHLLDLVLQTSAALVMLACAVASVVMPTSADEDEGVIYAVLAVVALAGLLVWQLLSIGIRWGLLKARNPSMRRWLLVLLGATVTYGLVLTLLVTTPLSKDHINLARFAVILMLLLALLPTMTYVVKLWRDTLRGSANQAPR